MVDQQNTFLFEVSNQHEMHLQKLQSIKSFENININIGDFVIIKMSVEKNDKKIIDSIMRHRLSHLCGGNSTFLFI